MENSTNDEARGVTDLVDDGDVLMLTSAFDGLLARPITCAEVVDDRLAFLVSAGTDWVDALEDVEPTRGAVVGLTATDPEATRYASFSARARVLRDEARAEQLWSPFAKPFFTGPDDPKVRVLELEVLEGEWWDGPSTGVGRLVALVGSVVTGKPLLGDQGRVSTGRSGS
jgi:general stress protein 26